MPRWVLKDTRDLSDEEYQAYILQGVSRTFALTIPQLPPALAAITGNAYLLCRITDTIEDDTRLSVELKQQFINQFITVISGDTPAHEFTHALLPLLGESNSSAEIDLVIHTGRVVRLTHAASPAQQKILLRCVTLMAAGMAHFQGYDGRHGLADLHELNRYCYHVAGVVGELLTELYCDYNPGIQVNHGTMMDLAVHFGQALQLTNILKDVREDMSRGVCWLPKTLFAEHGVDLKDLPRAFDSPAFAAGITELIAISHGHLCKALAYTLLIPSSEKGFRRFCLWAIGMAMLTLRKINADRHYRDTASVKISRTSLKMTIALTNASVGHDRLIRSLFRLVASGLPKPIYSSLSAKELCVKAEQGSRQMLAQEGV